MGEFSGLALRQANIEGNWRGRFDQLLDDAWVIGISLASGLKDVIWRWNIDSALFSFPFFWMESRKIYWLGMLRDDLSVNPVEIFMEQINRLIRSDRVVDDGMFLFLLGGICVATFLSCWRDLWMSFFYQGVKSVFEGESRFFFGALVWRAYWETSLKR